MVNCGLGTEGIGDKIAEISHDALFPNPLELRLTRLRSIAAVLHYWIQRTPAATVCLKEDLRWTYCAATMKMILKLRLRKLCLRGFQTDIKAFPIDFVGCPAMLG